MDKKRKISGFPSKLRESSKNDRIKTSEEKAVNKSLNSTKVKQTPEEISEVKLETEKEVSSNNRISSNGPARILNRSRLSHSSSIFSSENHDSQMNSTLFPTTFLLANNTGAFIWDKQEVLSFLSPQFQFRRAYQNSSQSILDPESTGFSLLGGSPHRRQTMNQQNEDLDVTNIIVSDSESDKDTEFSTDFQNNKLTETLESTIQNCDLMEDAPEKKSPNKSLPHIRRPGKTRRVMN